LQADFTPHPRRAIDTSSPHARACGARSHSGELCGEPA